MLLLPTVSHTGKSHDDDDDDDGDDDDDDDDDDDYNRVK